MKSHILLLWSFKKGKNQLQNPVFNLVLEYLDPTQMSNISLTIKKWNLLTPVSNNANNISFAII